MAEPLVRDRRLGDPQALDPIQGRQPLQFRVAKLTALDPDPRHVVEVILANHALSQAGTKVLRTYGVTVCGSYS